MKKLKFILLFLFIFSCAKSSQTNNKAIANFDVSKYLGKWYEIARYNHIFEKNCQKVTAQYSLLENNKIQVINKCFKNGEEKIATGKAHFVGDKNIAHLKVTFFWPFYGDYKVIYLDKNYSNAIIDGGSYDYFWILSREKKLTKHQLEKLILKAESFGYERKKMIFVEQ